MFFDVWLLVLTNGYRTYLMFVDIYFVINNYFAEYLKQIRGLCIGCKRSNLLSCFCMLSHRAYDMCFIVVTAWVTEEAKLLSRGIPLNANALTTSVKLRECRYLPIFK